MLPPPPRKRPYSSTAPTEDYLPPPRRPRTAQDTEQQAAEFRNLLTANLDCIPTAAFSRSGTHLITGSRDHMARIWRARTDYSDNALRFEHALQHPDRVFQCYLSDNGRAVTSCADGIIRIWEGVDRPFKTINHLRYSNYRNSRACQITPDGDFVLASFFSGHRRSIDNGNNFLSSFCSHFVLRDVRREETVFERDIGGRVDLCCISRDAQIIALGLSGIFPAPQIAIGNEIVVFNFRGHGLARFKDVLKSHSLCNKWDLSDTGKRLAIVGNDHFVVEVYESGPHARWDIPPVILRDSDREAFSQVRFAQNSKHLITISNGMRSRSVKLFSIRTRAILLAIRGVFNSQIVLAVEPRVWSNPTDSYELDEIRVVVKDAVDAPSTFLATARKKTIIRSSPPSHQVPSDRNIGANSRSVTSSKYGTDNRGNREHTEYYSGFSRLDSFSRGERPEHGSDSFRLIQRRENREEHHCRPYPPNVKRDGIDAYPQGNRIRPFPIMKGTVTTNYAEQGVRESPKVKGPLQLAPVHQLTSKPHVPTTFAPRASATIAPISVKPKQYSGNNSRVSAANAREPFVEPLTENGALLRSGNRDPRLRLPVAQRVAPHQDTTSTVPKRPRRTAVVASDAKQPRPAASVETKLSVELTALHKEKEITAKVLPEPKAKQSEEKTVEMLDGKLSQEKAVEHKLEKQYQKLPVETKVAGRRSSTDEPVGEEACQQQQICTAERPVIVRNIPTMRLSTLENKQHPIAKRTTPASTVEESAPGAQLVEQCSLQKAAGSETGDVAVSSRHASTAAEHTSASQKQVQSVAEESCRPAPVVHALECAEAASIAIPLSEKVGRKVQPPSEGADTAQIKPPNPIQKKTSSHVRDDTVAEQFKSGSQSTEDSTEDNIPIAHLPRNSKPKKRQLSRLRSAEKNSKSTPTKRTRKSTRNSTRRKEKIAVLDVLEYRPGTVLDDDDSESFLNITEKKANIESNKPSSVLATASGSVEATVASSSRDERSQSVKRKSLRTKRPTEVELQNILDSDDYSSSPENSKGDSVTFAEVRRRTGRYLFVREDSLSVSPDDTETGTEEEQCATAKGALCVKAKEDGTVADTTKQTDNHAAVPDELETKSKELERSNSGWTKAKTIKKGELAIPDEEDGKNKSLKLSVKAEGKNVESIASALEGRAKEVFNTMGSLVTEDGHRYLSGSHAFTGLVALLGTSIIWIGDRQVAELVYRKVGTRNVCTFDIFVQVFCDLIEEVQVQRRQRLEELFGEAAMPNEDSLIVFHARDTLKEELRKRGLGFEPKWTDEEMDSIFENVSSGMLVSAEAFIRASERILLGKPEGQVVLLPSLV